MIKEGITKNLLDVPPLHNANNDIWRYLKVILASPTLRKPDVGWRTADFQATALSGIPKYSQIQLVRRTVRKYIYVEMIVYVI
jgi:hypothetical protein